MSDDDARYRRLRAAVLAVPTDPLRAAVRAIGEDRVRALTPPARALVNQLRRASNPADTLRRIPNAQVIATLADVVADESLEVTRAVLGEAADDPTMEQLLDALAKVLELFDVGVVRVMLATVAFAEAEASDKCDELLTTDERFVLEVDDDERAAEAHATKAGPSPEVAAQRQARKEAKQAKKAQRSKPAPPPKYRRGRPPASAPTVDDGAPHPAVTRRSPTDVPDGFDVGDPLVGALVIADVTFEDDLGAKSRPCVVVAASSDELLVRPGYSEGGMQSRRWQSYELRDWHRAGCTKPTWIEPDARTIRRSDAAAEPIGRLTDDDWNALF
jgi:hypothetical protein